MPWHHPRRQLFLCAALDLAGIIPSALLTDRLKGSDLIAHPTWLLSFGATDLLLGWLLGSDTVLRWPGLPSVLRRLLTPSAATLLAVIPARWILNLPVDFSLGHRSTLLMLLPPLTVWSLAEGGSPRRRLDAGSGRGAGAETVGGSLPGLVGIGDHQRRRNGHAGQRL